VSLYPAQPWKEEQKLFSRFPLSDYMPTPPTTTTFLFYNN
jgi:hypothetical protein